MPEECPYCNPSSDVLRAALRRQSEDLRGLTLAELYILVADLRMEVLALKWRLRQEEAGRRADAEAAENREAQLRINLEVRRAVPAEVPHG